MTEGTLQINTERLLPIIKKWLYSDKEIFLRELVSNGIDALTKLKILSEKGECEVDPSTFQVKVTLNKEKKTLTFTDTGIGMTAKEVETYIAQLAFSGAEEFLQKYEREGEESVIGHFGLGFYSSYMVASKVEIRTLSYQKDTKGAFWVCDGSATYTLDKCDRSERGTEITLFLEDDEFTDEAKLRTILHKYCSFLPYPVLLGEERVNPEVPLYLKLAAECTKEEYLEFFRKLHPMEPDPIFWVHLNVDFPFNLKGILYFPKITKGFDFQKQPLQLYCNRVFVSDNCRDLVPDFLAVMRGAIDSPDIPLNVSRSYLQMDSTVRSLSNHIAKKVADRLAALYRTEPEEYKAHWNEIETIVKLGALQDEKFYERAKEFLIWETLDGEWVTLSDREDKVFYTQDPKAHVLGLYQEKGIEVILARGPVDTAMIGFLESKHAPVKFQRVDGGIDDVILDGEENDSGELATFVKESLGIENLEVEAKSLASDKLHTFLMVNEETRRLRDAMAMHGNADMPMDMFDKKTFVVNTRSGLIDKLHKHEDKELSASVLKHLYQLAQLSQRELPPEELPNLIEQSHDVLERILTSSSN